MQHWHSSRNITLIFLCCSWSALSCWLLILVAKTNVGPEARMFNFRQLLFCVIYSAKSIVHKNITRICKWIHFICGWVITDTFTIRVGARIVTIVALIVVCIDFFINMGDSFFTKWTVMPIGCIFEYIGCKFFFRNPSIIMFFYCEIGNKTFAIFNVTEFLMKCFGIKIKIIVIGKKIKSICNQILW